MDTITVSMDEELLKRTRQAAKEDGRSVSNFISWVLNKSLEQSDENEREYQDTLSHAKL